MVTTPSTDMALRVGNGEGLVLADRGRDTLNKYDAGWAPPGCEHEVKRRVSVSYTAQPADQCSVCGDVIMRS